MQIQLSAESVFGEFFVYIFNTYSLIFMRVSWAKKWLMIVCMIVRKYLQNIHGIIWLKWQKFVSLMKINLYDLLEFPQPKEIQELKWKSVGKFWFINSIFQEINVRNKTPSRAELWASLAAQ